MSNSKTAARIFSRLACGIPLKGEEKSMNSLKKNFEERNAESVPDFKLSDPPSKKQNNSDLHNGIEEGSREVLQTEPAQKEQSHVANTSLSIQDPSCSDSNTSLLIQDSRYSDPRTSLSSVLTAIEIRRSKKELIMKSRKDILVDVVRDPEKKARLSPNYFVAIPILSPLIHSGASSVQQGILPLNPDLQPAMVSLAKLHITLMVLRLENDNDVARAHSALDLCRQRILDLSSSTELQWPISLPFRGLSHFRNQVLYMNPAPSDGLTRLHEIAESVKNCFMEHGLLSTDRKNEFNPHLTLMKLSKSPKLRRIGIKQIPTTLYTAFQNEDFGMESVTKIQLCSMTLPANEETGYYFCSREVNLVESDSST